MVVDGTMLIEGVKEPIAYRYPQAIASGFAIGERDRHLDIGTLTALLKKTVGFGHRRAIELEEAQRKAEIRKRGQVALPRHHEPRAAHPAQRGHRLCRAAADARRRADREQRRGYIVEIRNSGAHLLALISDILDYSKLEAGHLPLSETVFDLRRFLLDSVRLVRAQAAGICRSRRRLRLRCVVNLLANAISFDAARRGHGLGRGDERT